MWFNKPQSQRLQVHRRLRLLQEDRPQGAVCQRKKKGQPRITMLRTRPVESEPVESESEGEQEATMMVLQVNSIERKRRETIYRVLVDSRADTGGAYQKKLMPICNDKESDVSTCEEGGSKLQVARRGTMSLNSHLGFSWMSKMPSMQRV